ncbi:MULTISPECIES: hypothetical protein [unclassified Mesorhizobium]|uniref:hypothetical protein n=2 Tax=Mesorhizobium TaxID=68287 RepID=UPI003100EFAE
MWDKGVVMAAHLAGAAGVNKRGGLRQAVPKRLCKSHHQLQFLVANLKNTTLTEQQYI